MVIDCGPGVLLAGPIAQARGDTPRRCSSPRKRANALWLSRGVSFYYNGASPDRATRAPDPLGPYLWQSPSRTPRAVSPANPMRINTGVSVVDPLQPPPGPKICVFPLIYEHFGHPQASV